MLTQLIHIGFNFILFGIHIADSNLFGIEVLLLQLVLQLK